MIQIFQRKITSLNQKEGEIEKVYYYPNSSHNFRFMPTYKVQDKTRDFPKCIFVYFHTAIS